MSKKTENTYGKILGIIGNVLLWAAILAYYIIVPLYFKNGYERIATNKYRCMMLISKYAAISIGSFILLYLSTWGFSKEERAVFKPIAKIDIAMLGLILFMFISHKLSAYKAVADKAEGDWYYEGSFYGTSGWFMGFVTFLIFVFMYFAITRFFKYTNLIWIPILTATSLIYLWGMLNRYGVYPIEMAYSQPAFISSLGNINWFAGFVSVMAPISVGLFFGADNTLKMWLTVIPLVLSHCIVLLNNSDSIVFGYMAMMFFLLCYCLSDKRRMVRFSWILFSFAAVALGLNFLDKALPGIKEETSAFSDIFTKGATSIAFFVLSLGFTIFVEMFESEKLKYSEKAGLLIRRILLIGAGAGFVLFVLLLVVNTKTGGALPIIGKSSVFTFNDGWGSDRGATWKAGYLTFKEVSFGKKLIGVGPDVFYFGMKDCPTAFAFAHKYFDGARLTNAHGELLTLLVNIGIIGTGFFVFVCVSSVKAFTKASEKRPYIIGFALSVICYLANNIFSFEQITGTPFFLLTIGLGAAAVARVKAEELRV